MNEPEEDRHLLYDPDTDNLFEEKCVYQVMDILDQGTVRNVTGIRKYEDRFKKEREMGKEQVKYSYSSQVLA